MKIQTHGIRIEKTLAANKLKGLEAEEARKNAEDIVSAIMTAYGVDSKGQLVSATPAKPITGLVYGKIQSGKTRAMTTSTAMAFDNGFRIAVVLTSNINDLVKQTHVDFVSFLEDVLVFSKDADLTKEVSSTKLNMEHGGHCLILVVSKGNTSLKNVSKFLNAIDGYKYPTIIFDDEGDQASLDTNTLKRSKKATKGILVDPSPINQLIQASLRPAVKKHVYVSVTGTPQAVLLQSLNSTHKPSFLKMLPSGKGYCGGDTFFFAEEPENNEKLITLVDEAEKEELLDPKKDIPVGLKKSLQFYLVAAAAAIKINGVNDKGYAYLCHSSRSNDEQAEAETKISAYVELVNAALLGVGPKEVVMKELKIAYDELCKTLKNPPTFTEIVSELKKYIAQKQVLVINNKVKRNGITYNKGLNIFIGGNTLGRGIAVKNLLVTYYVRESKISQIDTMHQHARMYGYRDGTIDFIRVYIPKHLYYKFRDIHSSDKELRAFIEKYEGDPATFPIAVSDSLKATRSNVLDVGKVDTIHPGKQIYPNYISLPQKSKVYSSVFEKLVKVVDSDATSPTKLEKDFTDGVNIDVKEAKKLVRGIKTKSKNTWRDATVEALLDKVAEHYKGKVNLRFRTADRTVADKGFISTGTLSGTENKTYRAAKLPTLVIMSVTAKTGSAYGAGEVFMYPTLVIPDNFPKVYVFNKG